MTNQHPITPPPELVQQWFKEAQRNNDPAVVSWMQATATKAAQWGADQELEACCAWLHYTCVEDPDDIVPELRAARRPEPPSLKEQALYALDEAESSGCLHLNGLGDTIRRALEALPND